MKPNKTDYWTDIHDLYEKLRHLQKQVDELDRNCRLNFTLQGGMIDKVLDVVSVNKLQAKVKELDEEAVAEKQTN